MTFRASMLAAVALPLAIVAPAKAADFDPLTPRAGTQAPATPERIRRLPADAVDLALTGEYARRGFAVHLTDAEAASARELKLSVADRAVSVLPETASLTVYVNGQALASLAGSDLAVGADIRLPVAPGLLVPGFNEVTFEAHQQHRVDCSVEGGYELWTRLDADDTGLVLADPTAAPHGLAGLPQVLQGNGAPGTLRLVLSDTVDDRFAGAAVRAGQAIALAGRAWRPSVSVVTEPAGGEGTNVRFVGTAEAGAYTNAGAVELSTGLWAVPRAGEPGRRDLVVVAGSAATLDRISAAVAGTEARTVSGTREGLAVLASAYGVPVVEETAMPLEAFGVRTIAFAGRHLTEDLRVTLPSDFFASGYGSVRLSLKGRYAPGLEPGSMIRIRVNDAVAGSLPIAPTGGVWNDLVLQLPLGMFHPGANTVQFEAVLQTAEDRVCDVATSGSIATRVTIESASTLTFPRLARVGNLPEIGATLMSGYPYSASDAPVPVWIAGRDRTMLGAAATLAAELAVAQGRPIPVEVNFRTPVATDRTGFVIAPVKALPDWLARNLADDPAFTTDRAAAKAAGPAVPGAAAGVPVVVDANLVVDAPPKTDDATADPLAIVRETIAWIGSAEWSERSGDLVAALGRTVRNLSNGIVQREIVQPGPNDLTVFQTADLPIGISVGDAIFRAGAVPNAWTVFTADTTPALVSGLRRVAEGQRWNQLSGRLTIVRDGSTRIDALPADRQVLTATREFEISNGRLALAGWFSRNSLTYAQLMIAMCVLVGALGWLYAVLTGSRRS